MSERQSLISRVLGSRGLKGISEIRTFFRTNEQRIFFIGATRFNLLGIDRWVRGFEYMSQLASIFHGGPARCVSWAE